ncbi:hypothetical protein NDA03_27110 [Trichocoleus sp. Lan]|uniref:hypothetical protein n=1 Tax=Trichocoleus sp. Lan TaxID=2933927 RepID=UPI003296B753
MNHFSPPATPKKQSHVAQRTLVLRVAAISGTIMLSKQPHNQQGFVLSSSLNKGGVDIVLARLESFAVAVLVLGWR